VGLGTFKPIRTERVEDHTIHAEHYKINAETAQRLNETKKAGKKILAVGTTTVRALESAFDPTV
jgi:S-adenosylmethionine:tRNA ribosyltransferase-isomerase